MSILNLMMIYYSEEGGNKRLFMLRKMKALFHVFMFFSTFFVALHLKTKVQDTSGLCRLPEIMVPMYFHPNLQHLCYYGSWPLLSVTADYAKFM